MMKKIILTTLLFSNLTCADTIFGVYAGIQSWYYDNSSEINTIGILETVKNSDLGNENSNSIFVSIEHAVPFIPNIKLKHTDFEVNNIINPFIGSFDGFPNGSARYYTFVDLSHTDATLYYELLDNWINLDLGLSLIYFDGKIDFNPAPNFDVNYSEFIPALYGKALFKLPITNLSASVTANIGTLTKNTIVDLEVAAQYKIGLGFSVEAGVRQQTIDLKDFTETKIHSNATGVFAALNFHF